MTFEYAHRSISDFVSVQSLAEGHTEEVSRALSTGAGPGIAELHCDAEQRRAPAFVFLMQRREYILNLGVSQCKYS